MATLLDILCNNDVICHSGSRLQRLALHGGQVPESINQETTILGVLKLSFSLPE